MARLKPRPAGIHGIQEAVPSSGIEWYHLLTQISSTMKRRAGTKEAEAASAHSPEPGSAVATRQAERATAALGPTTIQDGPVILNPVSASLQPVSTANTSLFFSSGVFYKDLPTSFVP